MTAEPRTRMTTTYHSQSFACVMSMAERELAAFISVVADLYGSEQARISAEDWLDELNSSDALPESTTRGWRSITIAAAVRLASRLSEMGFSVNTEAGSCKE